MYMIETSICGCVMLSVLIRTTVAMYFNGRSIYICSRYGSLVCFWQNALLAQHIVGYSRMFSFALLHVWLCVCWWWAYVCLISIRSKQRLFLKCTHTTHNCLADSPKWHTPARFLITVHLTTSSYISSSSSNICTMTCVCVIAYACKSKPPRRRRPLSISAQFLRDNHTFLIFPPAA